MRRLVLLPALLAILVGAPPALAWTWPVDGPVLQSFVLGDDPYAPGQHRGIDVGTAEGVPVRAPASGTVTFAGTVPGGGRTITIQTPDGLAVTLLHLGAVLVAEGHAVAEGADIGAAGWSGDPEHPVASVHLGDSANIATDTYQDRRYQGVVSFIATEAEFTPRNVQTTEERVKLVYAVKVRVIGDDARDLKVGMPVDVFLHTLPDSAR